MSDHPDPAAIRQMCDAIESVFGEHKGARLNMRICEIREPSPKCGTVACFAGWYYVSQHKTPPGGYTHGGNWKVEDGWKAGFTDGIHMLLQALGMGTWSDSLTGWASKYHELWGNRHGGEMFFSLVAYNNEEPGLGDMPRLLAHWRGVADRIEEWTRRGREKRTEA